MFETESVPTRSSRRAHFPSRHGEWDTPSRFWSHPTTASPTPETPDWNWKQPRNLLLWSYLRSRSKKNSSVNVCRSTYKNSKQQQHVVSCPAMNPTPTSKTASERLPTFSWKRCPPSHLSSQPSKPVARSIRKSSWTSTTWPTAAILDKMATPETTACTDIVMASTTQKSTATSSFHSSAFCTRSETTTVIASSPPSLTSTSDSRSSVTDRDRKINRHETATPCTELQKVTASQRLSFSMEVPGERPGDPGGTNNYHTTQAPLRSTLPFSSIHVLWQVGISCSSSLFIFASWQSFSFFPHCRFLFLRAFTHSCLGSVVAQTRLIFSFFVSFSLFSFFSMCFTPPPRECRDSSTSPFQTIRILNPRTCSTH